MNDVHDDVNDNNDDDVNDDLNTMTTMPIIMMLLVCCPEFNKLLLYCVCLYACVCVCGVCRFAHTGLVCSETQQPTSLHLQSLSRWLAETVAVAEAEAEASSTFVGRGTRAPLNQHHFVN